MEEIWRDIKGFEGFYQVSNLGRVRSVDRYFVNKRGQRRFYPSKILKQGLSKNGYPQVNLKKKNTYKCRKVHRLVATAFINNPMHLTQVNHIDENKMNNNVNNLEWCTASYNNNYGTRLDRAMASKSKGVSMIDDKGRTLATFFNSVVASQITGIGDRLIRGVAEGKRHSAGGYIWKYLK